MIYIGKHRRDFVVEMWGLDERGLSDEETGYAIGAFYKGDTQFINLPFEVPLAREGGMANFIFLYHVRNGMRPYEDEKIIAGKEVANVRESQGTG